MKIGQSERRILDVLQRDGRISNVLLAEAAGISESPCLRKTRALEESGIIEGYKAVLSPRKIGLNVSAYILVNLDQRSETITNEFFDALQGEPRVTECVALTGSHDLLLKVVARDIDDLAELTMGGILSFDSVKDISSCIVLKAIKPPAPLPVDSRG
ncbi:Lrp/AsnC family transcriptional regulator [Kineobactrum salinum]|uniref:Lrp/AsnC family transcriptional regulator n=1 Tax=Kineobactrum salinum TaxID=2708301 RepID=A0A6C0UAE4_9GAMM|nr:Lrp/AsnC family transcriptional regulator [Kineobactrum salinum]QIB66794.1 Lrp/AsnC family transcriptional regulator [Kineobactrum salinum]